MKRILWFLCLCLGTHLAFAQMVVTEIMYNANSSESTNETEFVELVNVTGQPVSIDGWDIGDADDNEWNLLPDVTVPAYGILVVCGSSEAQFRAAWGSAIHANTVVVSIADLGQTMFNLSNSPAVGNEIVAIRNGSDTIIDQVDYDDASPWPSDSPDGPSIYLNLSATDVISQGTTLNDSGANWSRSSAGANGAINNTASTVWNGVDSGSPGNFFGEGAIAKFIVINEVDATTPDGDVHEFIELIGGANTDLDGYVLVLYDGATDQSYDAIDLDGYSLNADGFFVVCADATEVANCDLDITANSAWLNDGAAAVALYQGDAADFPNGTALTTSDLVDAVVYDSGDPDDAELLALTPSQPQVDESANGTPEADASARIPDGGTALETVTYVAKSPTPGVSNQTVLGVKINEYVANHSGMDRKEFVEILGDASTDYSTHWVLQIEGDSEANPGTVYAAIQCGTTQTNGIWFSGFFEDVFGNDSATLLLVEGFSGMLLQDLDTNDDGVLDLTPWTAIADSVAVDDSDSGDRVYSSVVFTPGFDGDIFAPGGLSRIPNGTNTGQTSDWKRNAFNGAGLPGFSGTVAGTEAANTPNEPNGLTPSESAIINEFVSSHDTATRGVTEAYEYIEISGARETDYSAFTIVQLDGALSGNPGRILSHHDAGTTSLSGLWHTGFLSDTLSNNSLSLILVKGFSGSDNDDLDSNDDGVLDTTPWVLAYDSVALRRSAGDLAYGTPVLDDAFDLFKGAPDGASRIPNGQDTDAVADWVRNDFDGAGLPGYTGTLVEGESLNTPGTVNVTTATVGTSALINEFVANHTGGDDHEYVEIIGTPSTSYASLWILVVEGDVAENPGHVDTFWQVGATDANGYWTTGFLTNQFEDTTMTLLLVQDFTGPTAVDLDTNDDGTLDVTPWTTIVDAVGVQDNGATDKVYAATILAQNYDGISFTVGGASRLPNGVDTDTSADWVRNDFNGEGLPGFSGTLVPGEAVNTPGAENSDEPPSATGAILSEFVIDHSGADSQQFVEVFGEARTSYHSSWILVVDGDLDGNPGHVDKAYQVGTMNSAGVWDTGARNEEIPLGSMSLLLVEGFTGAEGDDLDSNDDGTLDTTPWDAIADSIAANDGGLGDLAYSTVGLGDLGGASRVPYGRTTGSASDWWENDFEGAGLDGFVGNLEAGEAYNTRGSVNRVGVADGDYYAGVTATTSSALRTQIHETIRGQVYFPYTSDFDDTWTVLEEADQDPTNAANILDIYKNASYAKAGGGNAFYNREHSWAKSYGFPDDTENNYPYTDCHHLRLSDSVYNSTRNNLAFGTCDAMCSELPTDVNNGQGGGSGSYPGNSNWHEGSGGNGTFEVWQDRRGDVARSLLYMDVRYEGGSHAVSGGPEPDLILTDDVNLIQTTGVNAATGYLGRLSVLLQWHEEDPVSADELARNEVVYRWQGNRNPFVDHPEWVACVYGVCLTPCLAANLPAWTQTESQCITGTTNVLEFIEIVNGTCACE